MEAAWWVRPADNRCNDELHIRASTYMVVLLSVVCVVSADMSALLLTTARVLAIAGIVLTVYQFARDRCPAWMTIGSVACHAIPYAICAWKTTAEQKAPSPHRHLVGLCVYTQLILIYMLSDSWPYSLPPLVVLTLGLSVILTD